MPLATEYWTGYLGGPGMAVDVDVEVNGHQLKATVHFALVEARLTCVGFDVRSFTRGPEGVIGPVGGAWTEITSPLLRGIRSAAVIAEAAVSERGRIHELYEQLQREYPDLLAPEFVREGIEPVIYGEDEKPRRGPKPLLDDAALRDVVAPAYLMAARKPVQAVREALAAAIPAYKGEVSSDIGRKAVSAARARGFIPPAKRSQQ